MSNCAMRGGVAVNERNRLILHAIDVTFNSGSGAGQQALQPMKALQASVHSLNIQKLFRWGMCAPSCGFALV